MNVNVLPVLLATNATITVRAIHTVKIVRERVAAKMVPNVIHQMANASVPMAGRESSVRIESVLTICMANSVI